jgi:hypothetical protein
MKPFGLKTRHHVILSEAKNLGSALDPILSAERARDVSLAQHDSALYEMS